MKNSAHIESVTDESGTDHRVKAIINSVVLHGNWTRREDKARRDATSIDAILSAIPPELATFDAAVEAELPCVSTAQFNSHEICKWFAVNVRKRMAGTGSDESKKGEA